ncbi:uncharacterized protein G6M90_00g023890 [Metarhizium brunneum]|uniref:Uncharacterized protein n=1 Tax=Metarhizium brunneum TaxID=500148 RepID=A0A7D5USI6_9HYPO|nr:hypothetical protein G6M90_00g023890 [Metarhizium brunneum]
MLLDIKLLTVLCSIQSDSCPWADVNPSNRSRNRHDSIYYCQPTRQILVEPFDLGPVFRPKELAPITQPLQNPVVPAGSRNTIKLLECPIEAFLAPELLRRLVESSRDETTEIGEAGLS